MLTSNVLVLFAGLVLVTSLLALSVGTRRATVGFAIVAVIALGTLAFLAAAATVTLASRSCLFDHLSLAFLAMNVSFVACHFSGGGMSATKTRAF